MCANARVSVRTTDTECQQTRFHIQPQDTVTIVSTRSYIAKEVGGSINALLYYCEGLDSLVDVYRRSVAVNAGRSLQDRYE